MNKSISFAHLSEFAPKHQRTHAVGNGGQTTSYKQGRAEPSDSGELQAAFDGKHGWFWRNRTSGPVTVTLKTNGAYVDIKKVM